MLHASKQDDWLELLDRRFAPGDVERLTGVNTVLQRKWVQLHLRDAQAPGDWWDVSSGRRQFTWSGVQFFQFFREITEDLGTRFGLSIIHSLDETAWVRDKPAAALIHSNIFGMDHRNREQGDLFIFRSLGGTASESFYSASAAGLRKVLANDAGNRLYTYNLSSMQRRLSERAGSVVGETLNAFVPPDAVHSE